MEVTCPEYQRDAERYIDKERAGQKERQNECGAVTVKNAAAWNCRECVSKYSDVIKCTQSDGSTQRDRQEERDEYRDT